jgi:hypothetical protein
VIGEHDPTIWPLPVPGIKRRRRDCLDSGVDISFGCGIGHYYSVHSELWRAAVTIPERQGMLWLDCLEKRLGRPLVRADFVKTPFEMLAGFDARFIEKRPVSRAEFTEWLDEEWAKESGISHD